MLTTTQLFVRWTAVVEHQYNMRDAPVHSITPLVELTWWQKILFPDLNFAMHVYHHMHPGVSFSNLPKVHKIYKAEGLVDDEAVFHGQGAFLRRLVRRDQR
jgi:fatty acid desaturase